MAVDKVISGLASKAVEKAVQESNGFNKQPTQSFKDMLDNVDNGWKFANQMGVTDTKLNPNGKMEVISVEGIEPASPNFGINSPDTSQKVVDMLSDVNKGNMQMDNLVNNILYSDKKFTNQELLVIQAQVFQHAQVMELTVKLAGEGVTSVKTVLNTQVQ